MQDVKIKAYVKCPRCRKVAVRLFVQSSGILAGQTKCKGCGYEFEFNLKLRRAKII